jgi:WD40 repeat protein
MGLPSLNPSWKLNLKHDFQNSNRNYKTLKWAPTILDQERVLFIGHDEGIDIFIVDVAVEKILCHYLGTIPFQEEISSIYSVLEKQESKTFLLVAVSKNKSMALSWKITINPDGSPLEKAGTMIFKGSFLGKINCVSVDVCSSICMDLLTSSTVRCPINFVPYEEETTSKDFAYHMVNGCADGSLKLLKFNSSSNSNWEIVGTLAAHEGPILKVSLTDCGKKIATVSPKSTCSTLCIWGSVNLLTAGSFILEY